MNMYLRIVRLYKFQYRSETRVYVICSFNPEVIFQKWLRGQFHFKGLHQDCTLISLQGFTRGFQISD